MKIFAKHDFRLNSGTEIICSKCNLSYIYCVRFSIDQCPTKSGVKPYENFDAFGEWCDSVWMGKHPMEERDLIIATMGICGEAGEVSEKVKKELRDGTNAIEAGILKELGDVVHYACTIARFYGYKPSDILKANYDKLEDRIARGTQRGSGDSR